VRYSQGTKGNVCYISNQPCFEGRSFIFHCHLSLFTFIFHLLDLWCNMCSLQLLLCSLGTITWGWLYRFVRLLSCDKTFYIPIYSLKRVDLHLFFLKGPHDILVLFNCYWALMKCNCSESFFSKWCTSLVKLDSKWAIRYSDYIYIHKFNCTREVEKNEKITSSGVVWCERRRYYLITDKCSV